MAKVSFNGPVAAFSGTISDLVYALQPDGSVNVRGLPEKKTKRSRKQLNQQDRMKHANAYWRSVKADPVRATSPSGTGLAAQSSRISM